MIGDQLTYLEVAFLHLQSDIYVGANIVLLTHGGTRRRMGCSWARWLRWCQSGLHTADKSGSSLGENSYNKGRRIRPSAVALKALLGSEREAGPDSLSRLS